MTKASIKASTKAPAKAPEFYLGGYDAKTCEEAVQKNFNPQYADAVRDEYTTGDLLRMEAGNRKEAAIGEVLKQLLGARLAVIPACDRSAESKARRTAMTLELMRNPGKVEGIWNARLPQIGETNQTGEPDMLWLHGHRDDGTPIWIPIDVKDHKSLEGTSAAKAVKVSDFSQPHPSSATETIIGPGNLKKVDALQLAHYDAMLHHLGFGCDEHIGGIIGREDVIVWHDLDARLYMHDDEYVGRRRLSAREYYTHEFRRRVDIAENALRGVALTQPEWKGDCKGCQWRTTCHDELALDLDHITLVQGISPARAKVHYERGVTRANQLAQLDVTTAKLVDAKIDVLALRDKATEVPAATPIGALDLKLKSPQIDALNAVGVSSCADALALDPVTAAYANSNVFDLAGSIDRARVAKVGKVFLSRNVGFIDLPRVDIELHVDIEDYQGHVYMIGMRSSGRGRKADGSVRKRIEFKSHQDWSGTPEGEAKVFADFWAGIRYWQEYCTEKGYKLRVYHYTQHEDHAFRSLAERHAGVEGIPTLSDVEDFLASESWVDLYPIVATQLIWPTEAVTLKDIAKWVKFSWRDEDPSGDNSIAWYLEAIGNESQKVRDEYQKRITAYNEDDCAAQDAVLDWLTRQGEAFQPGSRIPSVATLDARFRRRARKRSR
jgi:hypothetical protein